MTPTTGPPLKTWRRIVAGIQIIPTAGQFGTELRRTSKVADASATSRRRQLALAEFDRNAAVE
jgi:hypothetical protein